jgi:tetratricopeptide (TPR) repeat protein
LEKHLTPNEPTDADRERRLDEAIAQYLAQQAAGKTPNREAWLAQFPDLADDLRAFLDDAARMRAAFHPASDSSAEDQAKPQQVVHQAVAGTCVADSFWLESKLGEGGMGEVWVARQVKPVRRRVALKLIKVGMDSRAVLARFEAERQALALMDHPNIARVLDGGVTQEGHPFFVMELVNGLPLTKFCDEARLTPGQRLELFVQVCQGVQHAHHKGIVHRDLKPSNILVTLYDGKPVPKIIDFGVAKALAGKLGEESIVTRFGAMVGTLEYMSPEQAGFSGQDVDTRADIYSLGVILYELLTGLRPLDAQRLCHAAFDEMIRVIREEEPLRPSARLSTDESLPSLAALRQVEPRKLTALLRGELDWVVMKCLEKDRNRRYATAVGLATDLQKYLAGELVDARPPSTGYRLRKFVRRHRMPVVGVTLLLLTLVGGIIGTSMALVRARRAEQLATRQSVRATVVRDFLTEDLLGQAKPELNPRSDQITVEQLLDRAASRLQENTRLSDAPEARAEVLAVLGETYQALGQYTKAAEMWQRALELNRQLSDEGSDARALDALQEYGWALIETGRLREAEETLRKVVEQRRRVSGSEHTQTLFAINNLALALYRQGRLDEAEPLAKENWQTRSRVFGNQHRDTLQAIANYAAILMNKGDLDQAERMFREAVDGARVQGVSDIPDALEWENGLATALIHQQKFPEAKQLLTEAVKRKQRVLGPNHASTLGSRSNLAYVLGQLGEVDASVQEATATYEGLRAEYGESYHETLTAKNSLVLALRNAQRWEEAERHARELVETERLKAEPNQTDLITFTTNLGWVCEGQKKLEEAEKWYRESVKFAQAAGHADDPTGLDAAHNLTRAIFRQKRYEEALELGRQTLAARRRLRSPNVLVSARAVIDSLIQLERFDEAERELSDLLSTGSSQWPDDVQADLSVKFGQVCLRSGHFREAIEPLQRALAIRQQRFAGQWQVSEVRSLLGGALTGIGQWDQAEEALRATIKELDAAPAPTTGEATAVREAVREATNRRLAELSQAREQTQEGAAATPQEPKN